tara:strand:- start:526 stop:1335 length:810 start_codon:yes stop_codon:yes gene_type:complete
MKITENKLKRLIKEEIQKRLTESFDADSYIDDFMAGKVKPTRAIKVLEESGEFKLNMYDIDYFNSTEPIKVIGTMTFVETDKPCIKTTYEVGSIAVDSKYRGQKIGLSLYIYAMVLLGRKGIGLTSDHTYGTKPKAAEFWQRLEMDAYMGQGIARLRDTGKETDGVKHDYFDYNGRLTPDDPDDDCDPGMDKDPATNHSFEIRPEVMAKYDPELKKLMLNHAFVQELVYKGVIEIENLMLYPGKNEIDKFNRSIEYSAQHLFAREYSRS